MTRATRPHKTTEENRPTAKKHTEPGKARQIILLNFLKRGQTKEYSLHFAGVEFQVKDYCVGWDFEHAHQLIERYDGEVDGIVIAGAREFASFGSVEVLHTSTRKLMRLATKTPVYVGTELQTFFANWTMRRVLKEDPSTFRNRKILFHMAVFTPFSATILEQSSQVSAADALMLSLPFKLTGSAAIERFLQVIHPTISTSIYDKINLLRVILSRKGNARLQKWISESEVFITYASVMKSFTHYECFKNKVVMIDNAPPQLKEKLIAAGVSKIIEFMPDMSSFTEHVIPSFAVFNCLIDQVRIVRQSDLSLSSFTLELIDDAKVTPRKAIDVTPPLRRCAFVIHPLSMPQALRGAHLGFLKSTPRSVLSATEKALAHVPVFYYGQLKGARSELTGQEVECDLYALTATPKALMQMSEDRLYDQLVKASRLAKDRGALMIGLGAYTKVAGDSGVSVARRAPIPVTTGNSYSAAATLWAAQVMVERMQGILPSLDGETKLIEAKAMVIGATGSIGRVSSLLLAKSFKEIVLVATRPDKLLELRDEILESFPNVSVRVTTSADTELPDTDLIVTATSSRGKSILDIMLVKPGAVICDCSRPLDISPQEAARRPDVMVIESGEIDLPGLVEISRSIGLPKPSVYACLAETVLLTMEGRYENFSISRNLSLENVQEIYRIGRKHGARLSAIRNHSGVVTDEMIESCKALAAENLKTWTIKRRNAVRTE